jgi:hypothetical protein
MRRYTADELRDLPTLSVGQADDLKVDTGTRRVWLGRCGVADGAIYDNQVTVERLEDGKWILSECYEG